MIIAIMGKSVNENGEITGVKCVGKDTVRDIVKDSTTKYKVQYLNFADKLKETISDVYQDNVPDIFQRLSMHEYKELKLPELNNTSPRWLAEYFGTELMNSSKLLRGIWIKYYISRVLRQLLPPIEQFIVEMLGPALCDLETLLHELTNLINAMKHYDFPNPLHRKPYVPTLFLTSDLRFPAEYHALRKLKEANICNVLFVQVVRTLPGEPPRQVHPSNQVYPEMVAVY
jgi:hypothetical protein